MTAAVLTDHLVAPSATAYPPAATAPCTPVVSHTGARREGTRHADRSTDAPPSITVTLQVGLADGASSAAAEIAAALRELSDRFAVIGAATGHRAAVGGDRSTATGWSRLGVSVIDADTVVIDAWSRVVSRAGEEIPLCRQEFDLLLFLAEHPEQVFTRHQLLAAVWGTMFTGLRSVDVHISRLRHKVATIRPLIATVRGVGYRLAGGAPVQVRRERNAAAGRPKLLVIPSDRSG